MTALPGRRGIVVSALGIAQTLAWGSTYYLPAVFADPVCASLHLSRTWFFDAFSAALLLSGPLGPLAGRVIDRRCQCRLNFGSPALCVLPPPVDVR